VFILKVRDIFHTAQQQQHQPGAEEKKKGRQQKKISLSLSLPLSLSLAVAPEGNFRVLKWHASRTEGRKKDEIGNDACCRRCHSHNAKGRKKGRKSCKPSTLNSCLGGANSPPGLNQSTLNRSIRVVARGGVKSISKMHRSRFFPGRPSSLRLWVVNGQLPCVCRDELVSGRWIPRITRDRCQGCQMAAADECGHRGSTFSSRACMQEIVKKRRKN
jgi:hypothetical protein